MIPISVCIITKNEAEHLEKCLSSLKPYPFEIVVVDTGSSDNSKEVALKYTDKVFDFEWIDDFSAARNYSISRASHNLILILDTDELIVELDMDELERVVEANPKGIGMIKRMDYFETENGKRCQYSIIERFFNRKYYQYDRPIHEIIVPKDNIKKAYYDAPITADHFGYVGSEDKLRDKAMRDINLLIPEIEKAPNEPYYYFQMAQSYLLMRERDKALEYFQMAIERNPAPSEDYTRILVCNYGNILIDYGRIEEAKSLLSFYNYYDNNADYLCMVGVLYIHMNQQLKALSEFVKALSAPIRDSIETRVLSYYIGYIYEFFGQPEIAKQHYSKCGEFEPALEALERMNKN